MKKLCLLLMTAVLCCTACLAGAENEKTMPEAYEQILDMVKKGMAGDPDTLENEDFNSVINWRTTTAIRKSAGRLRTWMKTGKTSC